MGVLRRHLHAAPPFFVRSFVEESSQPPQMQTYFIDSILLGWYISIIEVI